MPPDSIPIPTGKMLPHLRIRRCGMMMYAAAAAAEIKPQIKPSREMYKLVTLPCVATKNVPNRQEPIASHSRRTGSRRMVMHSTNSTMTTDRYCSTVAVPELLLIMDVIYVNCVNSRPQTPNTTQYNTARLSRSSF